MKLLYAVILGLIQGLTEFIPVSSSGHLALFEMIFKVNLENQLAFDVMVHMGTLFAIIIYFKKEVKYLVQTSIKVLQRILDEPGILKEIDKFGSDRLPVLLVLGTIPFGVAGIVLGEQLHRASNSPIIIGVMLILVGIVMWFIDKATQVKKNIANIDYYDGLMIGSSQALALIKGTSRSGVTIATGRLLGYSLTDSAKFSFLLGIPSIGMSGVYAILRLIGNPNSVDWSIMIIGFITSFISGLFAIKILLKLLSKVGITPFVIYRVAFGTLIIVTTIVLTLLNR